MQIPQELIADCSPSDFAVASGWWETLHPAAQKELLKACGNQSETCAFSLDHESGSWIELPLVVDSRLTEVEEPDEDWRWEYWEYQLDHPEDFSIMETVQPRTFYIGTWSQSWIPDSAMANFQVTMLN